MGYFSTRYPQSYPHQHGICGAPRSGGLLFGAIEGENGRRGGHIGSRVRRRGP